MTSPVPLRIAVMLQFDTEHGRGILRGIGQVCRQHPDITVLKFTRTSNYNAGSLQRLALDGIIARVGSKRDGSELERLGIPLVNISGQMLTPRIPTVNTDDLLAGRMAARYLHGRGYRRFAFCGSNSHLASTLRGRGFSAEIRNRSLPAPLRKLVSQGDQTAPYHERVRRSLTAWVSGLPRPVAVLTFTDRLAVEIDDACAKLGLRVPEDVGILGVGNDLTRLDFAHTEISSVQLNTQRIGQLAAEKLLAGIRAGQREPSQMLIPPLKIVTRRSTDHFAVDDEAVMQAMDYIRENLGNPVYVGDIARSVGVSRRTLELKFRQALRTSVNAEVRRIHLERAVELMADPERSLTEIAEESGFGSAASFSILFRKAHGEAPSSHRLRSRGQDRAP